MEYFEIPLRTDMYSYFQSVVLDGVVYKLDLRYNGRMRRWFFGISLSDGTPLLSGVPMLPDFPMTYKFIGCVDGLPSGQFMVIDSTGGQRTPTRDDLGSDIKLIYISE